MIIWQKVNDPPSPPKREDHRIQSYLSRNHCGCGAWKFFYISDYTYARIPYTFIFIQYIYIKSFPRHVFHDTWIIKYRTRIERNDIGFDNLREPTDLESKGERSERGNSLFKMREKRKEKKRMKKINTDNKEKLPSVYCTVLFTRNESINYYRATRN